jgi:hypothetical protein
VYLTLGNEEVGLRWLHGAQQRFATAHDLVLLRQSLMNEMTYCTHKNKRDNADAIRRRLESLEANGEAVAAADPQGRPAGLDPVLLRPAHSGLPDPRTLERRPATGND